MSDGSAGDAGRGGMVGLVARGSVGGALMGLANLVPGISGGTMLLAVGVYEAFVSAVADVTTLKLRARSVVLLGSVVAAAGLAIVLLAPPVKTLVIEQRPLMYALFIGLTLGGVPLVWGMLKEAGGVAMGSVVGFVAALAGMSVLAFGVEPGGGGGAGFGLLVLAGAAGASAMILPGVSGGYLLLVLGVYTTILGSIANAKDAVTARDFGALMGEWDVVVPVGIGVVVGIVGLSNLIKWLLSHRERPTLGVLLGLLVGSVLGLWPFQETATPEVGGTLKGQTVVEVREAVDASGAGTGEMVAVTDLGRELGAEDWETAYFTPGAGQVGVSVLAIGIGFGVTMGIAAFGRVKRSEVEVDDQRRGGGPG